MKSKSKQSPLKVNFTLIELLTVIAIISLLLTLLLPALKKAKAASKRATCANNEKQLAVAANQYIGDMDGYVMPSAPSGWSTFYFKETDNTGSYFNRLGLLWKCGYITHFPVFVCPGRSAWKKNELLPNQNPATKAYFWAGYANFLPVNSYYGVKVINLMRMTWNYGTINTNVPCKASIACFFPNQTGDDWSMPQGSPHQYTGANILNLDGSVKWLKRGNRIWGGPYWDPTDERGGNPNAWSGFWVKANLEI